MYFIVAVSILQFCLYLVSDKLRYAYGRRIISVLVVLGHLIVFPPFFIPKEMRDYKCGMGEIGIYAAFWIFGLGASLLVWLIYSFVYKRFLCHHTKAVKK